jgi:hypothetical protein
MRFVIFAEADPGSGFSGFMLIADFHGANVGFTTGQAVY